MGAATAEATSWALAPGYRQSSDTVGGEMCGYWARGRLKIDTTPPSVITMEITEAKIGRSMKNRVNKRVLPTLTDPGVLTGSGQGRARLVNGSCRVAGAEI